MKIGKEKCDECGREFRIRPKKQTIAKEADGEVIREYFTCPKCKAEYTFSVHDKLQRKLMESRAPISLLETRQRELKRKYKIR